MEPETDEREGLRRWSRATLALAQQEGAFDATSMRRLLAEHFEQCNEPAGASMTKTPIARPQWQGSWIVSLAADRPPIVWSAPGSLGAPLYFPLVVGVPLPQVLLDGPALSTSASEGFEAAVCDRLQETFDKEVEAASLTARSAQEFLDAGQEWMNRHADLLLSRSAAFRRRRCGRRSIRSRSSANRVRLPLSPGFARERGGVISAARPSGITSSPAPRTGECSARPPGPTRRGRRGSSARAS